MKSIILFAILFTATVVVKSQRLKRKINCGPSSYEEFDKKSAKRLMFWDENRLLATNMKDYAEFCKENSRLDVELKEYASKCGRGVAKPIMSVLFYSSSRANRLYCTNKQRARDFVDAGHCANRNKKKSSKCMDGMIRTMYDGKNVTDKEKLPQACCSYFGLRDCSLKVFEEGGCTEKQIKTLGEYIEKVAIETLSAVCGEYGDEGSDKCERLLQKTKKLNTRFRWKSPVIPAVELLSSIEERS